MRQTQEHRRRREAFLSGVLLLARPDASVTAGGSRNGADHVEVIIDGITVNGQTLSKGFGVLFDDKEATPKTTQLAEHGVTTTWRDDMLHARRISDVSLVTGVDALRILDLSLG